MSLPLFIWSITAGLFTSIFIGLAVGHLIDCLINNKKLRHRLISIGSEREEIFIPGDTLTTDTEDYGDSDDF